MPRLVWTRSTCFTKARFPLGDFVARTDIKVGTVPTCSRRIFSPANLNQSRYRILVFALRRVNKVAKLKTGLTGRLCHGRSLFHQFTIVPLYINLSPRTSHSLKESHWIPSLCFLSHLQWTNSYSPDDSN